MRPKTGEKRRTWKCLLGCDQRKYMKLNGGYCPHLEKMLAPAVGVDSRRLFFPDKLDDFAFFRADFYQGSEHDDEIKLRAKLEAAGIRKRKIDVLVERLVKGKTFQEVAQDLGFSSAATANARYREAIEELRERWGKK